jgi:7,8-dihydropterin-6-yl-methyl-4-(beta-D-ribofuranosyl)aminobenzene 5'-phosphate synthase
VIKQSNTISIITACSHRGITNICKTATDYFNTSIQTLIGGFHTKEASELQYNCIKNYFNEYPVEKIAVCHCTGIDQYVRLSHDVSSHVVYNNTAKKITLNY